MGLGWMSFWFGGVFRSSLEGVVWIGKGCIGESIGEGRFGERRKGGYL